MANLPNHSFFPMFKPQHIKKPLTLLSGSSCDSGRTRTHDLAQTSPGKKSRLVKH